MDTRAVDQSFPDLAEISGHFFRSFLLSQGDPATQQRLFYYLAFCHPEWKLPSELRLLVWQGLQPLVTQYLSNGWHNPIFQLDGPEKAKVELEISAQLVVLSGALNDGCPMPRERLLEALLVDIINKDYLHLIIRNGRARPGRSVPVAQNSIHAPYFSHFCQFALLARKTGAAVFDQLFAELASTSMQGSTIFQEAMKRGGTAFRLERVLSCHNRAYPTLNLTAPGVLLQES